MVDKQNINARFIDKYNQGTTSVKLHAPPGGHSTFSLGWGDTNTNEGKKNNTLSSKNNIITNNVDYPNNSDNSGKNFKKLNNKNSEISSKIGQQPMQEKTSVRVKHAPGGESSIKFG